MIDIIYNIFRRKKTTSVEENLRFYIGISDSIISFGLFSVIFSRKLDIATYFGTDDKYAIAAGIIDADFWQKSLLFLDEKWLTIIFGLSVLVWFFLYKRAVQHEMEIIVRLYSRFSPPHDWERTLGRKWIPLLSVGITFAFLGLALFIDNIPVFCVIMLLLNVLDARGNNVIRQNLIKHFRDPKYVPLDTDLHKKFILQRREVAENYWIDKPQVERIGLMMIGVIIAFIISQSSFIFGFSVPIFVPIITLILIICTNEYVMGKWRIERDEQLERIEIEQEEEDRLRTTE